jgi:hypothetical protein
VTGGFSDPTARRATRNGLSIQSRRPTEVEAFARVRDRIEPWIEKPREMELRHCNDPVVVDLVKRYAGSLSAASVNGET